MKYLYKYRLFFVISMIVLLLVICYFNYQRNVTFSKSTHNRNENYAAIFDVYTTQRSGLKLSIEKSIFDKTDSKGLFRKVESDFRKIKSAFGKSNTKDVNVFIVESTIDGFVTVVGNNVYCTINDIEKDVYRPAFINAAIGIKEPWKNYGAQAFIFNLKPNNTLLKDFYSNTENMNVLSLFAGYFTELCDEETRFIAQNTALSLASFINKKSGREAFISCVSTAEYADVYLKSYNIEWEYQEKYDLRLFNQSTYSKTREYPLIINTGREKIYLNIIEDKMETIEDMMKLLEGYMHGKNDILNYLKENAPLNNQKLLNNIEDPISIYLQGDFIGGMVNDRTIYAEPGINVLLHSLVRIMIPQFNWSTEGLALYFSQSSLSSSVRERHYNSVFIDNPDSTYALRELVKLTREYYAKYKPLPNSVESLDPELMFEAIAFATMSKPSLKSVGGIVGNIKGSDLNYPEAFMFTKYLIENHGGLDVFLSFSLNKSSFEACYRMDYDIMRSLWIKSIKDAS